MVRSSYVLRFFQLEIEARCPRSPTEPLAVKSELKNPLKQENFHFVYPRPIQVGTCLVRAQFFSTGNQRLMSKEYSVKLTHWCCLTAHKKWDEKSSIFWQFKFFSTRTYFLDPNVQLHLDAFLYLIVISKFVSDNMSIWGNLLPINRSLLRQTPPCV